ncbi:hypothetical protein [Haladaptatus sp. NG-WS-4]
MRAGMTVAVGYLAAVVLGLLVASQAGVAPSPLRALVIAGVVYPVAFASLGGAAVGLFARETSDRSGESVAR